MLSCARLRSEAGNIGSISVQNVSNSVTNPPLFRETSGRILGSLAKDFAEPFACAEDTLENFLMRVRAPEEQGAIFLCGTYA
jgi:hypothetical protein